MLIKNTNNMFDCLGPDASLNTNISWNNLYLFVMSGIEDDAGKIYNDMFLNQKHWMKDTLVSKEWYLFPYCRTYFVRVSTVNRSLDLLSRIINIVTLILLLLMSYNFYVLTFVSLEQSWEKPRAPQACSRNAQRFPRNTKASKQRIWDYF